MVFERELMDTTKSEWETRRDISSFVLSESEIASIISRASHAVVSWVTKSNQPVTAVMLFAVVDGLITVTSTTNRAKYHAWRRNPSSSFCIWDPENIGKQITLRGNVKISQDNDLLREYTKYFLTRAMGGKEPSKERLEKELATFLAPDRYMMQLLVDKTLSHDLDSLLHRERELRNGDKQS
tara:strand:- start:34076 stop:34621 length:546 start_codon:yes stop_codon:yes gene_type:complete